MNPMLIAALLTGGGSLLNWKIQNDAVKAQNAENQKAMAMERAAREAERMRQLDMEKMQAAEVAKALTKADPAEMASKIEAEAEAPDNEFVASADMYNVPTLGGQKADSVVAGDIGKLVADALDRTKGMLKAQSVLSSQGTGIQGTQDALVRMASEIGTTASNRQGSANVARMETSIPAATVTPSSSPIGDLMMLGGMLYGGLGGFGAGKPLMAPGTRAMVTPGMAAGNIFGAPLTGSTLPAIY